MKQHAINRTALAGTALLFSVGTSLFAGEPSPYIAPPPAPSDCSGCINPGFYVEGSLLYLNSYASDDVYDYDGEWDLGYRGSVGFENASGLFVELTGFYYEGDYDANNGFYDGDIEFFAIDAMIGDTIHCGEVCLAVAAGLRYGGVDADADTNLSQVTVSEGLNNFEFDGWGPVFEIELTRPINEQFGIYGEIRQSLLFGEVDYGFGRDSDTLASVTEIGLGVEASFGVGAVENLFVRLGLEGQYWLVDGVDLGLFGGVLKIGARF